MDYDALTSLQNCIGKSLSRVDQCDAIDNGYSTRLKDSVIMDYDAHTSLQNSPLSTRDSKLTRVADRLYYITQLCP